LLVQIVYLLLAYFDFWLHMHAGYGAVISTCMFQRPFSREFGFSQFPVDLFLHFFWNRTALET